MSAALRAIFGYCFLVFMTRIVGRRPGRQLTPFEYVLIFFIGGLMLTALIGDDHSLVNAMSTIMAVALTHFVLAWLKQVSPRVGRLIDGTPLLLLSRGELQTETMRKTGIADDDIMAVARDKGLRDLSELRYAVLERNGEISIVSQQSPDKK